MAQDRPTHRRHIEPSLSWKLIVAFSLVFSVVFALAFWWFYNFSTKTALNQITQDMTGTLTATIDGIDGDQFEALVKNAKVDETGVPKDDPRYIAHQAWIETVNSIEPRANTYSYAKGPQDREVLWIGDIFRKIHPEEATKFLEPYTPSQDFMLMGLSEVDYRLQPYSDKWGTWISAYGPIKNSLGENVGAVGIDFAADYVFQVQSAIRSRIFLAFLFTYGSLLVLVFLLSRFLTRPIVKLTRMTKCVAEGDYDQDFSSMAGRFGLLRDEISDLAETFSLMVDKVRVRELSLKRQVEELKIEIDEAKRQQQVQDIVDTDFFQDLRAKARAVRVKKVPESPDS
jgi:HAMP domain-containing protein